MKHLRIVGYLVFGTVLGIAAGILIATVYFGLIRETVGKLSTVSTFVSAGTSILLVAVTAVYVVLTREMVVETEKARKQEVMPMLNLELDSVMHGALSPKLVNVGNGPAMDVEATIRVIPDGDEGRIVSKNIAPGEFSGAMEPNIGSSDESHEKVVVEGTYTNVFGETKPFKDGYDVNTLTQFYGINSLMEEENSNKYLKEIAKELGTISDLFNKNELETLVDKEVNRPIVHALKEYNSLTLRELSQESGISPLPLAAKLTYLQSYGMVECNVDKDEIMHTSAEDLVVTLYS